MFICNENGDLQNIITFSEMLGAKAVMSDIKLSEESETLYIMTSDKCLPCVTIG